MTKVAFILPLRWERWGCDPKQDIAASGTYLDTAYGGAYLDGCYAGGVYAKGAYAGETDSAAPAYSETPAEVDCVYSDPAYSDPAYSDAPYADAPYYEGVYGSSAYTSGGRAGGAYGPKGAAGGSRAIAYSSGLRNSVMFQAQMLRSLGIEAHVVEVPGPYQVSDRLRALKPTHAIAEAIWIVPQYLAQLRKEHPHIRWAVRNHSPTQFLSGELSGYSFCRDYMKLGIEVMANDPRSVEDMKILAHAHGVHSNLASYGPNFYPAPSFDAVAPHLNTSKDVLDIGLFGAIRPLKAHIVQAFAALHFAEHIGKRVRVHINGGRIDMGAHSELHNVRQLFAGSRHQLVEHRWHPHHEFRRVIRGMDIALACNVSESFCVVAADAAAEGVPVVASPEIPWLGEYSWADPLRSHSVAKKMHEIWAETPDARFRRVHRQRRDLLAYNQATEKLWLERFQAFKEAK